MSGRSVDLGGMHLCCLRFHASQPLAHDRLQAQSGAIYTRSPNPDTLNESNHSRCKHIITAGQDYTWTELAAAKVTHCSSLQRCRSEAADSCCVDVLSGRSSRLGRPCSTASRSTMSATKNLYLCACNLKRGEISILCIQQGTPAYL